MERPLNTLTSLCQYSWIQPTIFGWPTNSTVEWWPSPPPPLAATSPRRSSSSASPLSLPIPLHHQAKQELPIPQEFSWTTRGPFGLLIGKTTECSALTTPPLWFSFFSCCSLSPKTNRIVERLWMEMNEN